VKRFLGRYRYWLLSAIGLVAGYVLASVWWHKSGRNQLHVLWSGGFLLGPAFDPTDFGRRTTLRSSIIYGGNRIFIDFPLHYRTLTNPYRFSLDPNGNPYLPPLESTVVGYEGFTYSGVLRRFGEPSLYAGLTPASSDAVFRLTAFKHTETYLTCRITVSSRPTGQSLITARYATVKAKTGELIQEKNVEFPLESWAAISKELETDHFWDDVEYSGMFQLTTPTGVVFEHQSAETGYHVTHRERMNELFVGGGAFSRFGRADYPHHRLVRALIAAEAPFSNKDLLKSGVIPTPPP
jgi:hypothetical protein